MIGPRPLRRFSTGVPGLDAVLGGGLFEGSVYIIQGVAGAGKTILANQICFHQAAQQRRTVYYTLLTEAHDRMIAFLQGLGFFDPSAIPRGVSYVSGFTILEAEGLPGVARNLGQVLGAQGPSLLVIDGLVTATELAPSGTALRKFVHELETLAGMFRATILLLTGPGDPAQLQVEHTMVDGVIELGLTNVRLKSRRSLEVLKLRGAGQVRGTHTFEIGEAGASVLPRIETSLASPPRPDGIDRARRTFGVPTLDAALHGGVIGGSSTMILGPSGTGKTLLSLHFMASGAAAGEPGLFVSFSEQPEELIAKATRLGLTSIAPAARRGALRFVRPSSVEANIDRIAHDLLCVCNELHPTRVVLDGLQGFQVTSDPPDRIQDFLAAETDHLLALGATFVFTVEPLDLLGSARLAAPFSNATRMTHNILSIRFIEHAGRMRRLFSILKLRDSSFDPAIRELVIGERGVVLAEPIADAAGDARRDATSGGRAAAPPDPGGGAPP